MGSSLWRSVHRTLQPERPAHARGLAASHESLPYSVSTRHGHDAQGKTSHCFRELEQQLGWTKEQHPGARYE
jgi:hypothetical protein